MSIVKRVPETPGAEDNAEGVDSNDYLLALWENSPKDLQEMPQKMGVLGLNPGWAINHYP